VRRDVELSRTWMIWHMVEDLVAEILGCTDDEKVRQIMQEMMQRTGLSWLEVMASTQAVDRECNSIGWH